MEKLQRAQADQGVEDVTLSRGETALALKGMTVRGRSMTDVLAAQNRTHAIRLVKELAFGKKAIAVVKKVDRKKYLDTLDAVKVARVWRARARGWKHTRERGTKKV